MKIGRLVWLEKKIVELFLQRNVAKYAFFKDPHKHELFLYFEPEAGALEGKSEAEIARAQRAHAKKIADELNAGLKSFNLIAGWLQPAGQKLDRKLALVSITPAIVEKNALLTKVAGLLKKKNVEKIVSRKTSKTVSHRIGEF